MVYFFGFAAFVVWTLGMFGFGVAFGRKNPKKVEAVLSAVNAVKK